MYVLPLNYCPLAWQLVEPSAKYHIHLFIIRNTDKTLWSLAQPLIKKRSVREKKKMHVFKTEMAIFGTASTFSLKKRRFRGRLYHSFPVPRGLQESQRGTFHRNIGQGGMVLNWIFEWRFVDKHNSIRKLIVWVVMMLFVLLNCIEKST